MRKNNKALYEQIMRSVSKEVKRALNEQSEYGYNYVPRNRDELEQAIQEHYDNDIYDLNDIDVSHITDFRALFYEDKNTGKRDFNICDWNVSKGEDFSEMFFRCHRFNCDLSHWDVSNGKDFSYMFASCEYFNSDVSQWDVSNGKDFSYMFSNCWHFNSDLSKWDVTSGKDFSYMFAECDNFKANLSNWDMLTNAYCDQMFYHCRIKDEYKPMEIIKKLDI